MSESRAAKLWKRATRMGVTFKELGDRIGKHRSTVSLVLREEESGLSMNRERILDDIEEALDVIQSERRVSAA